MSTTTPQTTDKPAPEKTRWRIDPARSQVEFRTPTFWGLVLFPVAVLLVFWGAIRPEERFLRERFGAAYDDYTRRVRRWL